MDKFRQIVEPVNEDNDIDGVVVGYRLHPNNVACLTVPEEGEVSKHFDADVFPKGVRGEKGADAGHSQAGLLKMVTRRE